MSSCETNAIDVGCSKVPLKWLLSGSTAPVGTGALADKAAGAEDIKLDLSGIRASDDDLGGDDKPDAAVLSARYGIAPGLDVGTSYLWADRDDEANGSQDGSVIAVGLNVSF